MLQDIYQKYETLLALFFSESAPAAMPINFGHLCIWKQTVCGTLMLHVAQGNEN
jgi:hypothetical protein